MQAHNLTHSPMAMSAIHIKSCHSSCISVMARVMKTRHARSPLPHPVPSASPTAPTPAPEEDDGAPWPPLAPAAAAAPTVEEDDGAAAPAAPATAPPPPPPPSAEGESEWGVEINGAWYPLSQLRFVVQLTYADGTTDVVEADHPSGP